jgi:hypothetical protein
MAKMAEGRRNAPVKMASFVGIFVRSEREFFSPFSSVPAFLRLPWKLAKLVTKKEFPRSLAALVRCGFAKDHATIKAACRGRRGQRSLARA